MHPMGLIVTVYIEACQNPIDGGCCRALHPVKVEIKRRVHVPVVPGAHRNFCEKQLFKT